LGKSRARSGKAIRRVDTGGPPMQRDVILTHPSLGVAAELSIKHGDQKERKQQVTLLRKPVAFE
jgi:hypothetical protein